jgi:hypothetical protein
MELLSFGKEELGRREFFDRLHESLTVGATTGPALGGDRHFDGRSLDPAVPAGAWQATGCAHWSDTSGSAGCGMSYRK